MRACFAELGSDVVVIPEERLIFLRPTLTRADAKNAIRAVLPLAHPDVVEHWLEQVMPTARPIRVARRAPVLRRVAVVAALGAVVSFTTATASIVVGDRDQPSTAISR